MTYLEVACACVSCKARGFSPRVPFERYMLYNLFLLVIYQNCGSYIFALRAGRTGSGLISSLKNEFRYWRMRVPHAFLNALLATLTKVRENKGS
jgi:hypothetical protein